MTPERAQQIVSAINDRCFFNMGLKKAEEIGSLKEVSLAEMLEASAMIEAGDRAAPSVGGTKTLMVIPDDRLIAAAYVLEHYQPSNESIISLPASRQDRFWHEGDTKVLVVGVVDSKAARDDEEEDMLA